METHGNFEELEQFEHRGRKVAIVMADRGAVHCGVQHEFNDVSCANCGEEIEADKVLMIRIDDSDLGVEFESLDLHDAVEFAKQYIDDLDDQSSSDGPVTAPPAAAKPPAVRGRRQKKDPNTALVPPSMRGLDETIAKLKWEAEGLRIIREVGGKKSSD